MSFLESYEVRKLQSGSNPLKVLIKQVSQLKCHRQIKEILIKKINEMYKSNIMKLKEN